jgi:translation initiation factor 2A
VLLVGGFENLPGNVDIWDFKKLKKVGSFVAECSAHCEWSRDSRYILTAVLSPRIRIDNGYFYTKILLTNFPRFTIWSYDGTSIYKEAVKELWQVKWEPKPISLFPNRPPSPRVYKQYRETQKAQSETESAKKYVPPHLRHLQSAPVSLKKEEEKPKKYTAPVVVAKPVEKDPNEPELSKKQKKKVNKEIKKEESKVSTTPALSEDEKQKKLKALKKKLRQIEELKQQKASGKPLLEEQEKKLVAEKELVDQINELEK